MTRVWHAIVNTSLAQLGLPDFLCLYQALRCPTRYSLQMRCRLATWTTFHSSAMECATTRSRIVGWRRGSKEMAVGRRGKHFISYNVTFCLSFCSIKFSPCSFPYFFYCDTEWERTGSFIFYFIFYKINKESIIIQLPDMDIYATDSRHFVKFLLGVELAINSSLTQSFIFYFIFYKIAVTYGEIYA